MNPFLQWWPVITVVGGGFVIAVLLYYESHRHTKSLDSLWRQKTNIESFLELRSKVDGMVAWSRAYEEKANEQHLHTFERMAALDKAVEVSTNNHKALVELVTRVEQALGKMEDKFEKFTERVEQAMMRRRAEG